MATSNGAVQNHGQIQWVYSVSGVSQGTTSVVIKATAYFMSVAPYSQYYNGTKAWSGAWGSGSAGQAYNLSAGTRVAIVSTGGTSVALTDAQQTRSFTVTAYHFFGTTTSTLTVKIPPRYARTPTGLTIARNSDTSHRLNWTRNSTYTAVVVQRRINGGSWAQVARVSGNAYTWTDTGTKAGNKYEYRVAGIGGSGQSGWSNTATVYTSPLAPTGITATRVGDNIRVDASGKPANATAYNVRDGSTTVATGVSLPWTHTSPNPAQTHQYTVQATRGSLVSPWSSASNVVQLQSPPLAPTDLRPNGGLSVSDDLTRFTWKHSPVDSSEQTVAEFRRRAKGATSWGASQSVTAEQHTQLLDAGDYEWQVRTKGAHPDFGPWSAIATVTVIDRPGVAITSPDDLWTRRTVAGEWTWSQPQGRPQSAWEAALFGPDGELERKTGTGATARVEFSTKVLDNVQYSVQVRAATGDVWSFPAEQWFYVAVPPAAPGIVFGEWDELSGSATLEVSDGRGAELPSVTNFYTNPRFLGNGSWSEVYRNRNPWSMPSGSTAGWFGPAGSQASTVDGITRTLDAPVGSGSSALWTGRIDVSPGEQLRLTMAIRNDGQTVMHVGPGLSWRDAADTQNHIYFRDDLLVLGPGEESVFSVVWEAPATATNITINVRAGGAGIPAGSRVTVLDGVSLVLAPCPPLLFHGSSPLGGADPDMRGRWTGDVGASASVLEGEQVRGVSPRRLVAIVSSVDGVPAMRLVPTQRYTQASDAWSYAQLTLPANLRQGGVILGTRHQESELTGVIAATYLGIRVDAPTQATGGSNRPGAEEMRLEYTALTGTNTVVFGHGGTLGSGDVWWTLPGWFEGRYNGPSFNGASGLVYLFGAWMGAAWDGEIDNSTSTLSMTPPAVRVDVERSVDGGLTWFPFIEASELPVTQTDPEAVSNGVTRYRVTTYSAEDAASVVVHEVEADSPAVWLSGGDGFTQAQRLPYDPAVTITAGRERVVRQYAGRATPVAHAGEAVTRTLDYGGTLITDEHSPEDLADLVSDPAPVHLYRDPDGRHIYGALGTVQLERHAHMLWGFSFQLTETEH